MAEQTDHEVCSICLNDFQEPKIIECQHSFCYNCLEDYVHRTSTNGQFLCPLCRQNIIVPLGGMNEFSSKQQMANDSTLQFHQCDVCLDIQATCRCRDCQQHLCESCKSTHDKFVGCKRHIVVKLHVDGISDHSSETHDVDISENSRGAPVHPADFCPNHRKKKIEICCKDCLVAVCFKCFAQDHNGHSFLDLQEDDVREQIRGELKTLKVELEKYIIKLQNLSSSLQSTLSEVQEAAKSACENVDTHVRNICAKVHEMGENIKEEIQTTCNEENEKFTKLMTDIKTLTEDLQSGDKFSTSILEDNSIVQVLERLPRVFQEAEQCRSRKFNIPDVMYLSFKRTEINETVLREQLGEVDTCIQHETRFITTFNINQFKPAEIVYGSVKTFHGLPWCVSASKMLPDESIKPEMLDVFLRLIKTGRRSDILSCQVDFSLELINHKDENRSMTRHSTCSLKDFHDAIGWGFNTFTTWDILTNQDSGFLDSNNNFNIQVILKLMDVKRDLRLWNVATVLPGTY
ncbi:tripartite motif-containing protein 45-like [Patella vulgata]|uniref:tripartite motif-containing protein 45-like n=1 Tax=Patella vulgata TaxID=6465 RepID=UPI0024A81257|nr:tripartite motif-containing protein 45-like [Patella vulgata]